MSDRLKVRSGFCWDLDEDDIFHNNTIDKAIEQLIKLKSRIPAYQDPNDCWFNVKHGYESTDISLVGYREENDKEYNSRKEQEQKELEKKQKQSEAKKQKARAVLYQKEQDERAEYERLKSKFEK